MCVCVCVFACLFYLSIKSISILCTRMNILSQKGLESKYGWETYLLPARLY